jgi:hypothetical protein
VREPERGMRERRGEGSRRKRRIGIGGRVERRRRSRRRMMRTMMRIRIKIWRR